MLTIWGRENSFNVQKLLWACAELNLAYRRINAGGSYGRTRELDYLEKSPTGLVPLLETPEGLAIWESNSSLRWLGGTHGQHLYPPQPALRAEIDCWMDWQMGMLAGPMRRLFIGLVRTSPAQRDPEAIAAARDEAAQCWAALNSRLDTRAHVAGDPFSLADICIGPLAYRWFKLAGDAGVLPALARWFRTVSERPAFKALVERELT